MGVDGVLMYVQPGVRLVVGARGASSKLGNGYLEGKIVENVKNYEEMAKEILDIFESAKETNGITIAIESKLSHGNPAKVYDIIGAYETQRLRF